MTKSTSRPCSNRYEKKLYPLCGLRNVTRSFGNAIDQAAARTLFSEHLCEGSHNTSAGCRERVTCSQGRSIQDYQLQLVPKMLRMLRPDLTIGFFLHIPFPPVELFMQMPWRTEIDLHFDPIRPEQLRRASYRFLQCRHQFRTVHDATEEPVRIRICCKPHRSSGGHGCRCGRKSGFHYRVRATTGFP